MNKVTFNLSKFRKQANYDGGKGLVQQQTRCFQNCQKAKLEAGKSGNDAWQGCLKEFQTMKGGKWATEYSGHDGEAALKQTAGKKSDVVKVAQSNQPPPQKVPCPFCQQPMFPPNSQYNKEPCCQTCLPIYEQAETLISQENSLVAKSPEVVGKIFEFVRSKRTQPAQNPAQQQTAGKKSELVKTAVELPGGGISKCKGCGHQLTNDVRACPSCGKSNPNYWKAHGE